MRQLDALVEDRFLLLARHRDRVLVRVAVEADLVSGVHDHADLLGKGLHGMARHEPRGLDAEALKQLDQPGRADFPGEHAA